MDRKTDLEQQLAEVAGAIGQFERDIKNSEAYLRETDSAFLTKDAQRAREARESKIARDTNTMNDYKRRHAEIARLLRKL